MRDIINATLGNDHFLKFSTYSIARNGEGLSPCLSVSIPENLTKYWAYLDFKKPNGETFKTPRVDVADGKIEYNIPHAVLDVEGKLELQIVFQNENNEIWKSYVKEFVVRYSINATDDIPDKQDFITEAQKLLDEIERSGGGNAFSPTVAVEEIENGHKVSITDINGTQTFDVLNGEDGIDGKDGEDGHTPEKGVDYFTEEEKTDMVNSVKSAIQEDIGYALNSGQ